MHNNSVKAYKSIFLIGMMGAGKSSFGKYCSKELGYQFVDLDEELENRTGVKISEILQKKERRVSVGAKPRFSENLSKKKALLWQPEAVWLRGMKTGKS